MRILGIKFTLFVCASLLVSCGNSSEGTKPTPLSGGEQKISPAQNLDGLGFYNVNADVIPAQIKKAALSIFEVRTLAAGSDDSVKIVDASSQQNVDSLRQRVADLPADTFDSQDKIILNRQLDLCAKAQAKECPLTFEIHRSTAFLLDQGDSLVTNAHVVDSYFQALKSFGQANDISELVEQKRPLRMFLFNANGSLVVDPYRETLVLTKIPAKTKIAEMRNTFYAEDNDYVFIKSSKIIGSPLLRSKQDSLNAGKVFIVGYPGCTGCTPNAVVSDKLDWADRGQGVNSDGNGLKFSFGELEPLAMAQSFFALSQESTSLWQTKSMLFYTADSNHGNSGSPILDESGNVIGIHAGGQSKLIDGKLKRLSRGVIFN